MLGVISESAVKIEKIKPKIIETQEEEKIVNTDSIDKNEDLNIQSEPSMLDEKEEPLILNEDEEQLILNEEEEGNEKKNRIYQKRYKFISCSEKNCY